MNKLSRHGCLVKGLLAGTIFPRLAADARTTPGELDKILLGVTPGDYEDQVAKIAADCVNAFCDRLAKDATLDDLIELLKGAEPTASDSDEDGDEDDYEDVNDEVTAQGSQGQIPTSDSDEDSDEDNTEGMHPAHAIMKKLSGLNLPSEDMEEIQNHLNALSGQKTPELTENTKPTGVTTLMHSKDGKLADQALGVTKAAMDAALKTQEQSIAAKFVAAEECAPILGKINALAFDSADSIYAKALELKGVETKGVHPSAFATLLKMATTVEATKTVETTMAADASTVDTFCKKFNVKLPATF